MSVERLWILYLVLKAILSNLKVKLIVLACPSAA